MPKYDIGLKELYKPTPKEILRVADAIKATCLFAMGYSAVSSHAYLMGISIGLLVVSEFVSRLFGDKKHDEEKKYYDER